MPELPEVETVKRTLEKLVIGKKVDHVEVRLSRIIVEPPDPVWFDMSLRQQTIQKIERRGKFLRFIFDEVTLVSHLRMEGRYGLFPASEPIELHTHVIFHFTDHTHLRYRDVRQFGTMHVFRNGDDLLSRPLNQLGIEPLEKEFTVAELKKRLAHRHSPIKPLLLNQSHVVGIGNIYADESLFRARIHPERQASSLSHAEYTRLHEAIVMTLRESVEVGGSSVKSYVNGQGEIGLFQHQLKMYGRTDEPCVSCHEPIRKISLAGRGTHFCRKCQPLPRQK